MGRGVGVGGLPQEKGYQYSAEIWMFGEREKERKRDRPSVVRSNRNTVVVGLRSRYAHSGLVVYATALCSSRLFPWLPLAVDQLILTQWERNKQRNKKKNCTFITPDCVCYYSVASCRMSWKFDRDLRKKIIWSFNAFLPDCCDCWSHKEFGSCYPAATMGNSYFGDVVFDSVIDDAYSRG